MRDLRGQGERFHAHPENRIDMKKPPASYDGAALLYMEVALFLRNRPIINVFSGLGVDKDF